MDVNPNSSDAWFARLDQKLNQQDAALQRIETQVKATNGRVTQLEAYKNETKGKVAGFAIAVSAVVTLGFYLIEAGIRLTLSK